MTRAKTDAIAAGIVNFRDFGEIATSGGTRVVAGRLYRSGHLADAQPDAVQLLLKLDFETIADLRYARERRHSRSPWPERYASRILSHDLEQDLDAPHMRLLSSPDLDEQAIRPFYMGYYQKLPFEKPYFPLFAKLLQRMARGSGRTLIHCSIGKDRTGVLAAIILRTLGCTHEDVLADYMASRTAPGMADLIPEVHRILHAQLGRVVSIKIAEELLTVREEYLGAAFDAIDQHCGSLVGYLDMIGVDEAARRSLRARLLV